MNGFCREMGITRSDSVVPLHKFDHHIRADLDATSRRKLAVLRPLKVTITNLPDDHFESLQAKVPAWSVAWHDGLSIVYTDLTCVRTGISWSHR